MDLDVFTLRWAKVENLERLARSLRVVLPAHLSGDREKYHRRLAQMVATAIEESERQAAAETRRAMVEQERQKVAVEIADALGETGEPGQAPRERVVRQIARMVGLMGEEWVRSMVTDAAMWTALGRGAAAAKDGGERTDGGTFFQTAREHAHQLVEGGEMQKADFYRTFCWREPKPRASRMPTSPRARPSKPVRRVETPVPQAQSKPRRQTVVPEVYVTRRVSR